MNKKFIGILAAVAVVVGSASFTIGFAGGEAIGAETIVKNQKETGLAEVAQVITRADGVYQAEYDVPDVNGWKAFMELTIREGKIEAVVFDESSAQDEINPENDSVVKQLIDMLLETQDPTVLIEVEGGTELSKTFVSMATALLKQAEAGTEELLVMTQPNP